MASEPRLPREAPEGIDIITRKATTSTQFGTIIAGVSSTGVLSKSKIEVLDLLGEGEIEGLISGEYTYTGYLGNVGYSGVTFTPYENAPDTDVNFLRSIYWNEVPVVNSENQFNFQQVNVKFTPGRPDGANLEEKIRDETTVSRQLGERLRGGDVNSKTYRILNSTCKGCKINVRFNQLSETITRRAKYGDTIKTEVKYTIYYRPLFSHIAPGKFKIGASEKVKGKVSYGYIRSTEINFLTQRNEDFSLDRNFLGWEIKITRDTPESLVTTLRNQTFVDSITEIYGNTYIYPNSAIASAQFEAEYFSQIPNRAYHIRGLKVKVPTNYNPITRKYSGVSWDGTFSENKQWTNNPAWCYYDLLTNKRYGLGKYINSVFIDKWTLYKIAQYCDTLVSDGLGGLEPRFTCNLVINNRDEAYKVINDLASIFRGMVYYAGGSIFVTQDSQTDRAKDFSFFTNANVEDGNFQYSSSSRRVRHTVAIIRYNDKLNFFQPAVEYVEDLNGIRKYGIKEIEIDGLGCTSRGQAIRVGRWALLSEILNTEVVTFTAGMEGSILRPGDVFGTFDINRQGKRFAGRTSNITINGSGSNITLDSLITGFDTAGTYQFSLLTPGYFYDPTQTEITSSDEIDNIRKTQLQNVLFSGNHVTQENNKTKITFHPIFNDQANSFNSGDYNISGRLVWTIEATGNITGNISSGHYDYFRAIRINENEPHKYEVIGLEYNDNKYTLIESGLNFEQPDLTTVPASPFGLTLNVNQITENAKVIQYNFGIPTTENISFYQVYAKTDSLTDSDIIADNLIDTLTPFETSGVFVPLTDNKRYFFRVYSYTRFGVRSTNYANNGILIDGISPIKDIIISSLAISDPTGADIIENDPGARSTGLYETEDAEFEWQVGFNQFIGIPDDITYRISIRKPSINNIPNSYILYQTTGYEPDFPSLPTYEFTFDINSGINSQTMPIPRTGLGPFREYDLVVEAIDNNGNSSAGGNFITSTKKDSDFTNPNGYDIVYANNPPFSNIELSPLAKYTPPRYTDQWINPDGEVRVVFASGSFPDLAGIYLYYSTLSFTRNDVRNFAINSNNNARNITQELLLTEETKDITFPVEITSKNVYIALSLFDTFDQAALDRNINIAKDLYISEPLRIGKRATDTSTIQAFLELPFNNGVLGDWKTNSINIKSVSFTPLTAAASKNYIGFAVYFENPLANRNYSVVKSDPAVIIGSTTTSKTTTLFKVAILKTSINNPNGYTVSFLVI